MLSQACQFYAKYFEGPFQLKINAYHVGLRQHDNRFLTDHPIYRDTCRNTDCRIFSALN
jgi:hypothetical protein